MKTYFTCIALLLFVPGIYAQKKLNSIETTTGWSIHPGDSIRLGKGSNPDGSFKYVTSGKGLDAVKITDKEGKQIAIDHVVDRNYNYKTYAVFRIYSDGTLVVKNGLAGRFTLDIEPALKAGELLQKAQKETVIVVNQGSVADELAKLKKLYEEGALTKQEYEAQKKKLLSQ